MASDIAAHYMEEIQRQFRGYKRMGEGAIAQLEDEELFVALDKEANSVAIIIKHLAGNMRSRFTDFLTTDGEKPDRHRDQEFEINERSTRAEVMHWWEAGWACVFSALDGVSPDHVMRTIMIRQEPHTVLQAHQPPVSALCLSRWSDRIPRKALSLDRLEVVERAAGKVGRVQCQDVGKSKTLIVHSSTRRKLPLDPLLRGVGRAE